MHIRHRADDGQAIGRDPAPRGAAGDAINVEHDPRAGQTLQLGDVGRMVCGPHRRVCVTGLRSGTEDGLAIQRGQQVAGSGDRQPRHAGQAECGGRRHADLTSHAFDWQPGIAEQVQGIARVGEHDDIGFVDQRAVRIEQAPAGGAAVQRMHLDANPQRGPRASAFEEGSCQPAGLHPAAARIEPGRR